MMSRYISFLKAEVENKIREAMLDFTSSTASPSVAGWSSNTFVTDCPKCAWFRINPVELSLCPFWDINRPVVQQIWESELGVKVEMIIMFAAYSLQSKAYKE